MRVFAPALAALAAAVGGAAVLFLWQPGLDSLYDDSVSYLVMAQRFTPWVPVDPAIASAAAAEKYPPLFPLLLAFTGGAYDWRIAHVVVALSFGASVALTGLYAARLTASPLLGWLAAAAFALLPGSWLIAKGILSEYPFIALTLATLLAHARLGPGKPVPRAVGVLALLLAATILTRTVGVALAVALAIAELWRHVRSRDRARLVGIAAALAAAAALAGLWYVLRPAAKESYAQILGDFAGAEPLDIGIRFTHLVLTNVQALYEAWLHALLIFWGEPGSPRFIVALALGVLGLGAALFRAGEGHADALFVAVFLALLLVWPFPGQMYRLAFPVVPLLLAHALWAVRAVVAMRFGNARGERWAAIAGLLPFAASVPAVIFYIAARAHLADPADAGLGSIAEFYRIPARPAAEDVARRELDVIGDLTRMRETLPREARVMWYTPAYVALLARREGVPLRRTTNRADFVRQLRETRADYVYIADVQPRDSLWREGSPFIAMFLARGLADIEWLRPGPDGQPRAILLRIDPARLREAG
jgi:hypothetical protein